MIIISLCLFSPNYAAPATVTVGEDQRNVYVVFLDSPSIDINRGESVLIGVEIHPSDQPIDFRLSDVDSRVEITVDKESGVNRIVTVRDLTLPLDGTPSTPRQLTLQAFLPDGSPALTATAGTITSEINLKKSFHEFLQDGMTRLNENVDNAINTVPNAACNAIGAAAASSVQNLIADNPTQTPPTEAELTAFKNAIIGVAAGTCNALGDVVGSNIDVAINNLPPADANAPIDRDAVRPPVVIDQTVTTIVIGGFSLNTDLETGIEYSVREFVNFRPLSISFSPIETRLRTLQVNVNSQSATYDSEFRLIYSISNQAGSNSLSPFVIDVQFRIEFGGP